MGNRRSDGDLSQVIMDVVATVGRVAWVTTSIVALTAAAIALVAIAVVLILSI